MSVAPTECFYPPVFQRKDLERLAVVSASIAEPDWTAVDDAIQEVLSDLEREVRWTTPTVRRKSGRTKGERFPLFSYGAFSIPDSDIDPVVVGLTFTRGDAGINIEADISGEETGDCIVSLPNRTAPGGTEELLRAARELARELCRSANAIALALTETLRRIE